MQKAIRRAGLVLSVLPLLVGGPAPAQDTAPTAGALLPQGFFDQIPRSPDAASSIEADSLSFDSRTGIVTASGRVILRANGYTAIGEKLTYNRGTGALRFVGAVTVRDPEGSLYSGRDLRVTGGMKQAFYDALTITTPNGGRITADDARYDKAVKTVLEGGTYSPCGECIDAKGRRIGWRVRTRRMIYDHQTKFVTLDQPVLELLGVPVAWLPWLSMPDPTQKRTRGFQFPFVDYSDEMGAVLGVPYFWPVNPHTDLIFTPVLMSRQGVQLRAEWLQRVDKGEIDVQISGLYQLHPEAFEPGDPGRDLRWRGAIQTTGRFVPARNWTAGWSYTAFTDPAYLKDYHLTDSDDLVSEVYATNLTRDFYGDFRLQRFNRLGNVTEASQNQQALALPNARVEKIIELGPGNGRIEVSAKLLGAMRGADQVTVARDPATRAVTPGSPTYVTGLEEGKVHASFTAAWQKQIITPMGLVATPYLGVRGDAAWYDGSSPRLPGPTSLLSATPIAAMDFRFPLVARAGSVTQIIEPIAQLVWRGSDTTLPGITNDDAQSFVFDDTNLFSYNRFSGADRQETGLRANLGGRYQADLPNGGWVGVTAGQSFQLAGANPFTTSVTGGNCAPDPACTGLGSGLDRSASYVVAGVDASPLPGLTLGAKTQIDPDGPTLDRLGIAARYAVRGYDFGADYFYDAPDPARGTVRAEEVAGTVGIPIADYWTLSAGAAWDLRANQWLEADAGLDYDDGYLLFGAHFTATGPTNTTPDDKRFLASFKLKTPDGGVVGF